MTSSPAAKTRAGTPLTDRFDQRINITFNDVVKGVTRHGTIDLENSFYQIGGQYSDFHYRRRNLITMPEAVWRQLEEHAASLSYIEWYDREENAAYHVSWADAAEHGVVYEAGIGPRYGVPHQYFAKITERLS